MSSPIRIRPNCALLVVSVLALSSCFDSSGEPLNPEATTGQPATGKYGLYVTSGGCYGGGVVLAGASATVAVLDPETGDLKRIIADYGSTSPGDIPVQIANYDESNVLVAIENASGRRLDLVRKDGSGSTTYLTNSTALNGVLRSMVYGDDGTVLVAKSTAIEKFSPSRGRVTQGASPYVNAPGSSCATATTMMVAVRTLPNGKILYAHATASPNNKIGLISKSGYASAADCLATQAAPATTALPTSILPLSTGPILVGYGSTTGSSNVIQAYDLDITSNIFSGATTAFADFSILNGISAMAEHPGDHTVYVASALSTFNTIERFSFDPTSKVLSRLGPTMGPQYYTKCISSLALIEE